MTSIENSNNDEPLNYDSAISSELLDDEISFIKENEELLKNNKQKSNKTSTKLNKTKLKKVEELSKDNNSLNAKAENNNEDETFKNNNNDKKNEEIKDCVNDKSLENTIINENNTEEESEINNARNYNKLNYNNNENDENIIIDCLPQIPLVINSTQGNDISKFLCWNLSGCLILRKNPEFANNLSTIECFFNDLTNKNKILFNEYDNVFCGAINNLGIVIVSNEKSELLNLDNDNEDKNNINNTAIFQKEDFNINNNNKSNMITIKFKPADRYSILKEWKINIKDISIKSNDIFNNIIFANHPNPNYIENIINRDIDAANNTNINFNSSESIENLCMGHNFIAFYTDNLNINIYSLSGICKSILSIPHHLIAMTAYKTFLVYVYQVSPPVYGIQNLKFKILNVNDIDNNIDFIYEGDVALTPYSYLSWFGFSEEGRLYLYDSSRKLRCFSFNKGNNWLPVEILNKSSCVYNNMWIVGIDDDVIYYTELKPNSIEPNVDPRPSTMYLKIKLLSDCYFKASMNNEIINKISYKNSNFNFKNINSSINSYNLFTKNQEINNLEVINSHNILDTVVSKNTYNLKFKDMNKINIAKYYSLYNSNYNEDYFDNPDKIKQDNEKLINMKKENDKVVLELMKDSILIDRFDQTIDLFEFLFLNKSKELSINLANKLNKYDLSKILESKYNDFIKRKEIENKKEINNLSTIDSSNIVIKNKISSSIPSTNKACLQDFQIKINTNTNDNNLIIKNKLVTNSVKNAKTTDNKENIVKDVPEEFLSNIFTKKSISFPTKNKQSLTHNIIDDFANSKNIDDKENNSINNDNDFRLGQKRSLGQLIKKINV